MMRRAAAIAVAAPVIALLLAACGGGKTEDTPAVLLGTPIPTVAPPTPTAVVCTPPQKLAMPADFPAEIPVPPDYVVWSVQTTPFLTVVGRTTPPANPNSREPAHGVVAQALVQRLTEKQWTPNINTRVEGADYDMIAPDGRTLHFNAVTRRDCPGEVQLTYDVRWITQ